MLFLLKNDIVRTIKIHHGTYYFTRKDQMAKKEAQESLKRNFMKKKVLNMVQIRQILNMASQVTAFRYLRELHHLTSYTHNGKYYTLPEMVEFDENGFWYFGDIGFSVHATLINTLHHVITTSESGKSNSELERYCRTRVQDALRTLLQSERIARIKTEKRYLYVSADPTVSDRQIRKRTEVGPLPRLPDWIVGEILIETIRSCSMISSIEQVAGRLAKRGSSITRDHVKQVFEEHELEKKTLG